MRDGAEKCEWFVGEWRFETNQETDFCLWFLRMFTIHFVSVSSDFPLHRQNGDDIIRKIRCYLKKQKQKNNNHNKKMEMKLRKAGISTTTRRHFGNVRTNTSNFKESWKSQVW